MLAPVRVYADTSVFGGAFDREFAAVTDRFLQRVREARLKLVVSVLTQREVRGAPIEVRHLFDDMLTRAELIDVPVAAFDLQAAYIGHGVVSERWAPDALHVATATVSSCVAIVSWNFRHIVNHRRIPLYNAVNALEGYPSIAIHTPLEVLGDEEEDA